jgi:hypothetical protein
MSLSEVSRRGHERSVLSLILSSLMVVGSLMTMISLSTDSVSASVTGDGYVAPFIDRNGNWLVQNATVITGENVACTGNIYINGSGSLTIKSGTLTMSEGSQYEHVIYENVAGAAGFFKLDHAYLTSNFSVAGAPWIKITAAFNAHIYISNSTVNHTYVLNCGTDDYLDNSTMHASYWEENTATGKLRFNVSGNHFNGYTGPTYVAVCSANSKVTGNVFDSMTQTEDANYPGVIYINGGANTQAGSTRVIKNHFVQTVTVTGIYLSGADAVTVSDNVFENVSSARPEGPVVPAFGIGLSAQGAESIIENNTFKAIETTGLAYSESGGIFADNGARNYTIQYNDFWKVKKYANCWDAFAVHYGGKYTEIKRNHIFNVSGTSDDGFGMSDGIGIAGSAITSHSYANISWNTIDRLDRASNGIVFSGRSYGRIDNNTIHTISNMSNGMGVYIADAEHGTASYVDMMDNVITDLHRDSCGIIITHNASYDRALRNTVHISAQGTDNYPEGAAILVCGESFVAGAYVGASWTGDGCLVANNTITNDNADNDTYPEYLIWDANLVTKGPVLRLYLNEDSRIECNNATFNLTGPAGQLPLIIDGASVSHNATVFDSGGWIAGFNFSDIENLTVTLTTLTTVTDEDLTVNITGWDLDGDNALQQVAEWTASTSISSTVAQFNITGLATGVLYTVYVDGAHVISLTAAAGKISFSYDAWSTHTFEVYRPTIHESDDSDDDGGSPTDRSPSSGDPGSTSLTFRSVSILMIGSAFLIFLVVLMLRSSKGRSGKSYS